MPKHYLKTKILKIFKSYYEKILLIGTSPAMLLEAILLSKKYRNIEIHEKSNSWAVHGKLRIF